MHAAQISNGLGELFCAGLAGGEEGGDGGLAGFGELVAVGLGDLRDQTVHAEELELAGDLGRAAAVIGERGVGVQEGEQVAVAEAVGGEFAAGDGFEELGVGRRERVEGAPAAVVLDDALADGGADFGEGGGAVDGGESVDVALVRGWRDLGTAVQIGDPFPHGPPVAGSVGVVLFRAVDFEVSRVQQRGLDAQHRALFVIHLDRVAVHAML